MRYAQLIMGPAGSGKSTYCDYLVKHCEVLRRQVKVINLDPAAEYFQYPVTADIRDLIQLDDAMDDESLHFGPNGGLVFCMEYFAKNFEWLIEQLGEDEDDDYVIFDCPGQIELYTHLPIMRQLVDNLERWNFRVCGVFLVDAQFLVDTPKFFSGVLAALSVMVTLEIPHLNIMTKIDLLDKADKDDLHKYLEPDIDLVNQDKESSFYRKKFHNLNKALARIIQDYSLVKFHPLDVSDEDSIGDVLMVIDNVLQYGEDLDVKEPKEFDNEQPDQNDNDN
jgi:GTPase SAR1 family protein